MGAQCSDCVARAQFDPMVHSQFAKRVSNGRRQLLENNVGENPLDGYEISDDMIGEGAFGEVRLAVSRRTKAQCAIKTICKASTEDVCLRREIDILLALDHPHIVRLFDIYEDWRNVYMVFEMCSGGEVLDQILSKRRFNEGDALSLLAQLLYAINYAHSKAIAHRDIKLENILLKEEVEEFSEANLKVIDFGVARKFVPGKSTMSTMVGSPHFAAPEVLVEDARYNEKVDIWSAGIVGYMLLSGVAPFLGDSEDEILNNVRHGSLTFPRKTWHVVSQRAKDLVECMLTRNVSSRVDAQGALERLKEAIDHGTDSSDPMDEDDSMTDVLSNGSCASPGRGPLKLRGEYFGRLASFGEKNRFVKAGWHIIARHLEAEHLDELQDAFKKLDVDGTGVLTLSQLKDGFRAAGFDADVVARAFFNVDADKSDQIDYTDFVAALMDKAHCKREELCWEAFRVFDRDNDGHIGADDLHVALQGSNNTLAGTTKDEVEDLIRAHDKTGDRRINFQEFVAMMKQHAETPRG